MPHACTGAYSDVLSHQNRSTRATLPIEEGHCALWNRAGSSPVRSRTRYDRGIGVVALNACIWSMDSRSSRISCAKSISRSGTPSAKVGSRIMACNYSAGYSAVFPDLCGWIARPTAGGCSSTGPRSMQVRCVKKNRNQVVRSFHSGCCAGHRHASAVAPSEAAWVPYKTSIYGDSAPHGQRSSPQ